MNRDGRIIVVRRVYDDRLPSDGFRVLVDRIWPRGLTKASADLDEWRRDIAPSTGLRQWYGHCATRFGEFRARYLLELDDPAHFEALAHLRGLSGLSGLTLLTATKDLHLSHSQVLAERLSGPRRGEETMMFHAHINQPQPIGKTHER